MDSYTPSILSAVSDSEQFVRPRSNISTLSLPITLTNDKPHHKGVHRNGRSQNFVLINDLPYPLEIKFPGKISQRAREKNRQMETLKKQQLNQKMIAMKARQAEAAKPRILSTVFENSVKTKEPSKPCMARQFTPVLNCIDGYKEEDSDHFSFESSGSDSSDSESYSSDSCSSYHMAQKLTDVPMCNIRDNYRDKPLPPIDDSLETIYDCYLKIRY